MKPSHELACSERNSQGKIDEVPQVANEGAQGTAK
jgi:hypothetical protein